MGFHDSSIRQKYDPVKLHEAFWVYMTDKCIQGGNRLLVLFRHANIARELIDKTKFFPYVLKYIKSV